MNKIPMCACTSSQIKSHGYDPQTRTLAIEFKTGAVYHYADCPPEVYADMQSCESFGKFFGANVRGKFAHTMVTPRKEVACHESL